MNLNCIYKAHSIYLLLPLANNMTELKETKSAIFTNCTYFFLPSPSHQKIIITENNHLTHCTQARGLIQRVQKIFI